MGIPALTSNINLHSSNSLEALNNNAQNANYSLLLNSFLTLKSNSDYDDKPAQSVWDYLDKEEKKIDRSFWPILVPLFTFLIGLVLFVSLYRQMGRSTHK